jgi:hypothetical protein
MTMEPRWGRNTLRWHRCASVRSFNVLAFGSCGTVEVVTISPATRPTRKLLVLGLLAVGCLQPTQCRAEPTVALCMLNRIGSRINHRQAQDDRNRGSPFNSKEPEKIGCVAQLQLLGGAWKTITKPEVDQGFLGSQFSPPQGCRVASAAPASRTGQCWLGWRRLAIT